MITKVPAMIKAVPRINFELSDSLKNATLRMMAIATLAFSTGVTSDTFPF